MLLHELVRDSETDFTMDNSVKGKSLGVLEVTEVTQIIERTVTSCIANLKKA